MVDQSEIRERHLSAILDNTVEGIITTDSNGIVETYNLACEKIFGYNSKDVIGENVSMLMPDPQKREHDSYISNYIKTGHAKIIGIGREVTGRRKDGTLFPMDLSIGEVQSEDVHGFVGVIRDISERREAERKLLEYTEKLKQSNQALDEFVYIISHDLKEPLRGVYSYSQFLQEDYSEVLDDVGNARLDMLKKLSIRMEDLIDRLLYFSRLGRCDLAFKKTDMESEVRSVAEMLAPFLEEKGASLIVEGDLPEIVCDHARVGEVFRNLIVNAVKYNDSEAPGVWIGCDYEDVRACEDSPVFYVRDNGIGIPQKHQEAIFKMFKRLHGRDAYGGGAGAGLTIVQKIIERHNGRVWVDSDGETGSTFYFTLGGDDGFIG